MDEREEERRYCAFGVNWAWDLREGMGVLVSEWGRGNGSGGWGKGVGKAEVSGGRV